MTDKRNTKVCVGMSGGVDSSVSAALLHKQGYDVTGVFIKTWHPDFIPCTWKEDREDAMRVCAHLKIPFMTLDLEDVYKDKIVDYMIASYQKGLTPNPDVMCNSVLKFGAFFEKAREIGADYVATGHYARREEHSGMVRMLMGVDAAKDQTYFLYTLGQKELKHTLFPVGVYEKSHVRKLAEDFGVHTADKKDSQGLCFLGKVDMRSFLKRYIEEQPGHVLDELGNMIGHHEGAFFYTIGQRQGFTITEKTPHDKPRYIVSKNTGDNTLTVSDNTHVDGPLYATQRVKLDNVHWVEGNLPSGATSYTGRIRYRQKLQTCTCEIDEEGATYISFAEPQKAMARGQSVVLYDEDVCLGGGVVVEKYTEKGDLLC